jgi:hypothetical protein
MSYRTVLYANGNKIPIVEYGNPLNIYLFQDLQLLWTCMSLAEGEITPYQLNAEHRMLLSEPGNKSSGTYKRRALQSVRLSSVSSSGSK